MKVENEITIVGCDRIIEGEVANTTPIAECPRLQGGRSARFALICDLDLESQLTSRTRVASIKDLLQDFVAKVEFLALDSGLISRHE
jgi:hypothetical protein